MLPLGSAQMRLNPPPMVSGTVSSSPNGGAVTWRETALTIRQSYCSRHMRRMGTVGIALAWLLMAAAWSCDSGSVASVPFLSLSLRDVT